MNNTPLIAPANVPPLREWMHKIVPNVFDTMVALAVAPSPEFSMPADVDRVVGTIGLGGNNVAGAVYLQLTVPLADLVTSRLLGMGEGEAPAPQDVNDAIGELCNMVSGGFKSNLMDQGMACAISTPSIIRGTSFTVDASLDAISETFFFDCGPHRLSVIVHLQIQPASE